MNLSSGTHSCVLSLKPSIFEILKQFELLNKLQGTMTLGIPDFTAPYRPWLEGMKMPEGVYTRTEMVVDVDQMADLRGGTLITLCYAYSYTATK